MMNEQTARKKFAAYFLDLKEENARDGAGVNKQAEWEFFIEAMIEDETLPEEARNWKCPRTLKGLVAQPE